MSRGRKCVHREPAILEVKTNRFHAHKLCKIPPVTPTSFKRKRAVLAGQFEAPEARRSRRAHGTKDALLLSRRHPHGRGAAYWPVFRARTGPLYPCRLDERIRQRRSAPSKLAELRKPEGARQDLHTRQSETLCPWSADYTLCRPLRARTSQSLRRTAAVRQVCGGWKRRLVAWQRLW